MRDELVFAVRVRGLGPAGAPFRSRARRGGNGVRVGSGSHGRSLRPAGLLDSVLERENAVEGMDSKSWAKHCGLDELVRKEISNIFFSTKNKRNVCLNGCSLS